MYANGAEYEINNAQVTDTGTYYCTAKNSAGSAEERVQLIVSEDMNEVPGGGGGENEGPGNGEENKTTGPPRGDISGTDDSGGEISNTKPEDDLVNIVGSRAVLTCNAGMYKKKNKK